MNSNTIIGISILLFTYGLFSWALGRFMNKRKNKQTTELQNFLTGSWIMGLIIAFVILSQYIK